MNPTLIAILAVIVGGALTALQGPTNARLAGAVASPVNAALISFAVGTIALMIVAAALHTKPDMAATRALPPAAWLGGQRRFRGRVDGRGFGHGANIGAPRVGAKRLRLCGPEGPRRSAWPPPPGGSW